MAWRRGLGNVGLHFCVGGLGGLTEEATFEQRPGQSEGTSHVSLRKQHSWQEALPVQRL